MDFQLKSDLNFYKKVSNLVHLSHPKHEQTFSDLPLGKANGIRWKTNYLPLIEDPLWKMVYRDVLEILGGLATQLWNCKLGSIVTKDESLDLYCPTKEIAEFVKQYSFLILGSLQKYFPALKKLRITY